MARFTTAMFLATVPLIAQTQGNCRLWKQPTDVSAQQLLDRGRDGLKAGDMDNGVCWMKWSAREGNLEAALTLAKDYDEGKTLDKNHWEAMKYWRIAAKLGNPEAKKKMTAEKPLSPEEWWFLNGAARALKEEAQKGLAVDDGEGKRNK